MSALLYIVLGIIIGGIGLHMMYARFIFNKIKGENTTLKEGFTKLVDTQVLPVIDEKVAPKVNEMGASLVERVKVELLPELTKEMKNVMKDVVPDLVNPISERIDELEDKLDELSSIRSR